MDGSGFWASELMAEKDSNNNVPRNSRLITLTENIGGTGQEIFFFFGGKENDNGTGRDGEMNA